MPLLIPLPLTLNHNLFLFNKDKKRAFVDPKELLHCAVEALQCHLQANPARCVRPLFLEVHEAKVWTVSALAAVEQQALVLLHFWPLATFNYMGGIAKN